MTTDERDMRAAAPMPGRRKHYRMGDRVLRLALPHDGPIVASGRMLKVLTIELERSAQWRDSADPDVGVRVSFGEIDVSLLGDPDGGSIRLDALALMDGPHVLRLPWMLEPCHIVKISDAGNAGLVAVLRGVQMVRMPT